MPVEKPEGRGPQFFPVVDKGGGSKAEEPGMTTSFGGGGGSKVEAPVLTASFRRTSSENANSEQKKAPTA